MRSMSASDFSGMFFFVEAGRRKTLSAAAEALSLPVSSLSRRLAEFEKCLGIHLIDRTTRRFRLTAAGTEHFIRCEKVIDDARRAHGALQQHCDGMEGSMSIVATSDEAAVAVADQIVSFTARFPNIALTIEVVESIAALEALPYELGIHFGETERDSLITRRILDMPWVLVAASSYLQKRPPTQDVDAPAHHQFIVGGCTSAGIQLRDGISGELRVLTPESTIRATKYAVALSMAMAGAGIALMPLSLVNEALRTGSLQRVQCSWSPLPRRLCLIMKSRLLSARGQALADLLCGARSTSVVSALPATQMPSQHGPVVSGHFIAA